MKQECPRLPGVSRRKPNVTASGTVSERAKVASVSDMPPPAFRVPFRKRPCTERVDAPHPARRPAEAYPPRYGEGGQRCRGGCSGPRMPGSEGMDLWRPASQGPESSPPLHQEHTCFVRCGGVPESGDPRGVSNTGGGARVLRNVPVPARGCWRPVPRGASAPPSSA